MDNNKEYQEWLEIVSDDGLELENIYDEALEEMCLENDVPEEFRKELGEKYDIELPNKLVEKGR